MDLSQAYPTRWEKRRSSVLSVAKHPDFSAPFLDLAAKDCCSKMQNAYVSPEHPRRYYIIKAGSPGKEACKLQNFQVASASKVLTLSDISAGAGGTVGLRGKWQHFKDKS